MKIVVALALLVTATTLAVAQEPPPPPPPGAPPPPSGPPPGAAPAPYPAPAPPAAPPAYAPMALTAYPGHERHDGFYLRLFLGAAYTHMRADDLDATVKGGGGTFGIALGGAIMDNLVIYGELFDDVASNPDIEVGGFTGSTDDTSAGVVGIGAGLAYYFMPINLYVSGTLAASRLVVNENGEDVGRSDWGAGISFMVGKEWWVSSDWGLGVAGQLYLGSMKDQGDGAPRWNTSALGLVFSATFN